MEINNLIIGVEYQKRFLFYFLSLIFTLLALSVQTASFGNYMVADFVDV